MIETDGRPGVVKILHDVLDNLPLRETRPEPKLVSAPLRDPAPYNPTWI